MAATSSVAAFPTDDGKPGVPFVVNRPHLISDYVSAFLAAGLRIKACLEPAVTEDMLQRFPSSAAYPEATRDAFLDLPYLLIWKLER
jgi:hypothetical protein